MFDDTQVQRVNFTLWWHLKISHNWPCIQFYEIMPTIVLTLLVIVDSRKILNCNSAAGYWKEIWSGSWVVSPYGVWYYYYYIMFSTNVTPLSHCAGEDEVQKRTFIRSSSMPRDNVSSFYSNFCATPKWARCHTLITPLEITWLSHDLPKAFLPHSAYF